eukprot:6212503-Pleurochrysis_carterae.AAC.1
MDADILTGTSADRDGDGDRVGVSEVGIARCDREWRRLMGRAGACSRLFSDRRACQPSKCAALGLVSGAAVARALGRLERLRLGGAIAAPSLRRRHTLRRRGPEWRRGGG